jgi:hypothetical protein
MELRETPSYISTWTILGFIVVVVLANLTVIISANRARK